MNIIDTTVVFIGNWFDGLYMTDSNSIPNNFSTNQINELSEYIIDVYGSDMSHEDLNESIYLVMENIPGIEILSIHKIQSLTTQIRNHYYDKIQRNN